MKRHLCPLALTATLLLGACSGDDSSNENGAGTTSKAGSASASTGAGQAGASSTSSSSGGVASTSAGSPTTGGGTGATSASTSPGTTPGSTPTTNASPTTGAPAASGPTDVVLKEWSVEASKTSIKAGTVTFNIANNGQSKHEFVVIKGAYETLPQSAVGAVLEDDLASGALIGRTDTINAGSSAVFSTDLTAGPYTLLCNIASGPNSHAGKGQRLNIAIG